MKHMKRLARVALLAGLGVFLLATAGGCGGSSTPTLEPDGGEKIKQARINALGPNGSSNVTGPGSGGGGAPVVNAQAAARQKAQSGR